MWDDGTLHRLREAIGRALPSSCAPLLEDDDLRQVLQATFLGARPFAVEPNDVVIARMPGSFATAEALAQFGYQLRLVFPEQRIVLLPPGLDLSTERELIEQADEEPGDVPV